MGKAKGERLRLKPDEVALIRNYRKERDYIEEQARALGVDANQIDHGWLKTKGFSFHFKRPIITIEQIQEAIDKRFRDHAPKYPRLTRKKSGDGHLVVIDPADVHIGKLARAMETGEDYNQQIAVQRVRDGVDGLMARCASYEIEQIVFVGGNDILHTDGMVRSTTKGTPQDTDGQWWENFLMAQGLYIEVLERLMGVADVHFVHVPSNHDRVAGFHLAQTVKAWFRKSKNITFDASPSPRKYHKYYQNLIGFCHGDGAKHNLLPMLMSNEMESVWSDTKRRYWYTHHIHSKVSHDYPGVSIESLRSPSAADAWHSWKGYAGGMKAIECFVHHPQHGQVARFTHPF